jgi:peptidoglycan/LPS O-acetylase OafA/YrhL
VLSGFIIFAAHSNDFGQPATLMAFARKRFIRVYPLYLFLTLLIILLYILHFGHYSKLNAEVLIKSLLLFPQSPGIRPVLNPGWTLSLRRSRKLTHLCSPEVTHPQNRIENPL